MDPAAGEFFANGTEVEFSCGQIVRDAVVLGRSSETYFVRFKANTPGVAGHVRELGREDIRPVQPPEQQEEFELYDEVGVYWMGCWNVTVIMGEGIMLSNFRARSNDLCLTFPGCAFTGSGSMVSGTLHILGGPSVH